MAESVRSIQLRVEVDTSKNTYQQSFEITDDETLKEFLERVRAWVDSVLEAM